MVNSIYLLKLSGFLWWVLVRFCKTDLKEEQSKEKAGRNFLFLALIIFILVFITTKLR